MLELNLQTKRDEALFRTSQERFEASLIKNPITTEKAFAQFGLMLGTFPPMTIFGIFISQSLNQSNEFWLIPYLGFINFVCALTGYFSGKLIGKIMSEIENWNWSLMLLILPFLGILWGMMTGGVGGFFIFVFGAIFGALIAAMIGSIALPILTIFHRWLKKGDLIERHQLLPIAFGITFSICAFILGLNLS